MIDREELMTWGQTIVPCDCDDAYKSRGMEAPDCLWHQGAGPVLDELLDSGWLRKVRAEAWEEGVQARGEMSIFTFDAVVLAENPYREVKA